MISEVGDKTISVLIADDYFLIREGLKQTINSMDNISIAGEILHSEEINEKVKTHHPDILLLEINLCEKPVRDLVLEVKALSPRTKILIISDCNCSLPVIASIKAGISGFVRKNIAKEELFEAITLIQNNKQYFSKDITEILINSYSKPRISSHSFSERELEILQLICKGKTNQEIGDSLFISEKTVATHKRNIMKKASVKKTSDLILWAMENKLLF